MENIRVAITEAQEAAFRSGLNMSVVRVKSAYLVVETDALYGPNEVIATFSIPEDEVRKAL